MAEPIPAPCGTIDGGVHLYPLRVYYDDTDAAGIVYYANYLRMAERARTEMLRMIGARHTELSSRDGVSIAVSRCEIDYLRPARLDDELHIRTRITALGGATAQERRDAGDQFAARVEHPLFLGEIERVTAGAHTTRDDADAVYRVGAR